MKRQKEQNEREVKCGSLTLVIDNSKERKSQVIFKALISEKFYRFGQAQKSKTSKSKSNTF